MRRGAQVSVHLDGDFTPYNPLEIAIQQMTDEWFLEVQEELDADIEEAANRAMTQLRRTSPYHRGSGRGHYRSGWRTAVGKGSDNDLTYGSWARVRPQACARWNGTGLGERNPAHRARAQGRI